jgi:glycosyltransferase involved in cell wall biosynthesis
VALLAGLVAKMPLTEHDDMDMPATDSHCEGLLDSLENNMLRLWVWYPGRPDEVANVEVVMNNRVVGQYRAGEFRADLLAAGKGNGFHALNVDLRSALNQCESFSIVEIEVYCVGEKRIKFGSLRFQRASSYTFMISSDIASKLRHVSELVVAQAFENERPVTPAAAPFVLAGRTAEKLTQPVVGKPGPHRLSKYADFVRYRFRSDGRFQTDDTQADVDHYLKWYLEFYSVHRQGLRAPLSADDIAYLNEVITLGGQQYHLTRVSWIFMIDNKSLLHGLDLKSADSYLGLVYWWAIERARSLFVEDCLVPNSYRSTLNEIRHVWRMQDFPLNRFLEVFFSRNTQWHFFSLEVADHRIILYVAVMLSALDYPCLLQYLPQRWMRILLTGETAEKSPFAIICKQVFGKSEHLAKLINFAETMRERGFDVGTQRNLVLSREGHRLLSASFAPMPADAQAVDIQLIGPLRKASGLGQATRLSADVIIETGLSYSLFDFDLDNPAPVGFSPEHNLSELAPAKINLIHLNAESAPLAFAFLPDVFTGSYNIGYFFWELDQPAKCHALGMELLDEIWVSSQYGVEIYKPTAKCPVVNVGMAFQEAAVPERARARQMVQSRLGVGPDDFVFFAAFDSFSYIQRKNPRAVVRAFLDAFPDDLQVKLVLKTHNKDFITDPVQIKIWRYLSDCADADPRIIIVNETLPYDELLLMKTGCDCYVSLHKSEGLGFGMLEAMHLGVPVLATNYSGNTEFCLPETAWLVDYKLIPLGPEDYIFVAPGQQWAEPKHDDAVRQMREIVANPAERDRRAAMAQEFVRANFSVKPISGRYRERLVEVLGGRMSKLETAMPTTLAGLP